MSTTVTTIDTGQTAQVTHDDATYTVTLVWPTGERRQVARVPSLDLARRIAHHVAPVVYESGSLTPLDPWISIQHAIS